MTDRDNNNNLGEFEIIADIFAPLSDGESGAFNMQDDCARYRTQPGEDLVISCDAIVADVHFFADNPPASIAKKALGVNISDIAAKGAAPGTYLLTIALPKSINIDWLKSFASGLREMQDAHNIVLIGGDTVSTPGPLTVSVTILGVVPEGKMILRSGAQTGDLLYITGTIGDAFMGLQTFLRPDLFWRMEDKHTAFLADRYLHPQPRARLSSALLQCASAAMDVSDGLVADLTKLCRASGVGAEVSTFLIPVSDAAKHMQQEKLVEIVDLITGGDDYEILAAVNKENAEAFETEAQNLGIEVSRIGQVTGEEGGVKFLTPEGNELSFSGAGYDHFS